MSAINPSNETPNVISPALARELSTHVDCLPEPDRTRERLRLRREKATGAPGGGFLLRHSMLLAPLLCAAAAASYAAFRNPAFSALLVVLAAGSFCYARQLRRAAALRLAFQARLEAWVAASGDEGLVERLREDKLTLREILDAAAARHFAPLDRQFRPYGREVNPVEFAYGVAPSTHDEIMIDVVRCELPRATCVLARVRLRYEPELGNTVVLGVREETETFGRLERWYYAEPPAGE